MTALSTLEAYDLLRHCATLTERIARAEVDQLSRAGLEDEKVWLHQALERVEPLLPVIEEMLGRCRELPELAPAREDHAQVVQGAWVDALERLVGGLTLHAGSRAPILETLFPHLKFPPLRRASAEVVRTYAADLERRSRLGYVKRIFGAPDFAFVEPLMLAVFDRYEEWESCFAPGSLTEEEAVPLREALADLTAKVERDMRQARLLAEASLCPVEGAFESSGIGSRPRRRVGTVDIETPPGMDPEPIDDGVSLADALGWEGSGDPDDGANTVATDAAEETAEGAASQESVDAEAARSPENVDEDAAALPKAADEDAEAVTTRETEDAGTETVESQSTDDVNANGQAPRAIAAADTEARADETEQDADAEGVTRSGASSKGAKAVGGKARGQRKTKGKRFAKGRPTEPEEAAQTDELAATSDLQADSVVPESATDELATTADVQADSAASESSTATDKVATTADVQADAAPAVAPRPASARGGRRKGTGSKGRAKQPGDDESAEAAAVIAAAAAPTSGEPTASSLEAAAPTSDAADHPAQVQDGDAQAPATPKRSRRGRSAARSVTASTDD